MAGRRLIKLHQRQKCLSIFNVFNKCYPRFPGIDTETLSQIQLFSTNYSSVEQTPAVIKSKAMICADEFHAHLEGKNLMTPGGTRLWIICGTNQF